MPTHAPRSLRGVPSTSQAHLPLANGTSRAPLRVCLATVLAVLPSRPRPLVCGIVKWCRAVAAMRLMLRKFSIDADTLIMTDDLALVGSECAQPELKIRPFDAEVSDLIRVWATRNKKTAHRGARSLNNEWHTKVDLLKWHVIALTAYDVVLYTDSDVDVFPPSAPVPLRAQSAWAAHAISPSFEAAAEEAWTTQLYEFISNPHLQLAASSDGDSPVNCGVLLVKPNRSTFALGLDVLRRGAYNVTHGFDLAGRPRTLLQFAARRGRRLPFGNTQMVHDDTWDFVGGNAGQGLFSFVYLLTLRNALHHSRHHRRCSDYRFHHFWGGSKPWRLKRETFCFPYFDFLLSADTPVQPPAGANAGRGCTQWLLGRRRTYSAALSAGQGQQSKTCGGFNPQCLL
jgi:hypothetical protein